MPNKKSAKKHMKTSVKAQDRNRSVKTRVASCGRQFAEAIEAKDAGKAQTLLRSYVSVLDKAVKKGVLSSGAAARRKSRSTKKLMAIG